MSIKVIDSASKTTCGILLTVDHTVDSLQYLAVMAKSGLAQERRDQIVEGFVRASEQDKGNKYTVAQKAILEQHDKGIIV